MKRTNRVLAFDFGASSGRAILGIYDGERITLDEIHRFANDPVRVNGTLYWDVLRLFHEIKQGMLLAHHRGGFDSIGIDTWGVDFGLIDEHGCLLENPVHYRDQRTNGFVQRCAAWIPNDQFYNITGNQFMEINTAYQLRSLVEQRPHLLERAHTLLLMPDLFNYLLTGVMRTEYTIASTTQLLDARERIWSQPLIEALQIPNRLFTDIVHPNTVMGTLSEDITSELGIPSVPVISVASHDTQSAVMAVPTEHKDFIFISCGTWSLIGTELEQPLMNETSYRYNMTNEGGYKGTSTFMKNIIGLWIIQESRRHWQREGMHYSFAELEALAMEAKPFQCFIDPDAPEFTPPGNLPQRIQEYCRRTDQIVPETVGEIVRCINESLALKYRYAFEQIQDCTGKMYDTIHMVGGGIQSRLLCQMTANSCQRSVIAGPIEATILGNIASQLIAAEEIQDIRQARDVIANSQEIIQYTPQESDCWNEAFQVFKQYMD